LISQGQLDNSNELLGEALLAYPKEENLLYARSTISEKRGDYLRMEEDLLQIIEQNPNNATALNALGYVLANQNRNLDQAELLLSRAIQLQPDEPAILDSLGWLQYRLGNLEEAQAYLQQAYEVFPDPEVAAHLGEVLWQRGQREQATNIWQEGLQKDPANPIILETVTRLTSEPEPTAPDPQ
jgi:Tfp pilus assembly protein PilF